MKSIDELKDLTKKMETSKIGIIEEISDVIYHTNKGGCYGLRLYNNGNIAVQRAFLSKGTIFPEHIHTNIKEYLLFYTGKGKLIMEGKEDRVLEVGEFVMIDKDVLHSWEILEDSWIIGITIPADAAYP